MASGVKNISVATTTLGSAGKPGNIITLNGGVRSQIRTSLDAELPDKWLFTGNFRGLCLLSENAPAFAALIQ
jgi:hypothetical protein